LKRVPPSNEEVGSAFYVDYETWQDGPPVVLGVLRIHNGVESFRQEVLHEEFTPAAVAKSLAYSTPADSLERLADEITAAGAVLVAWSQHELDDLIDPYGSSRATEILTAAYRNAIPLARSWRRQCAPEWKPPEESLAAYLVKTGYHVPSAFGYKQTGQRLRAVHSMLASRDHDYGRLTRAVKGKWSKVLGHNGHDCRGMHHVCMVATGSDHDPVGATGSQS
jgi:hypothetical protein